MVSWKFHKDKVIFILIKKKCHNIMSNQIAKNNNFNYGRDKHAKYLLSADEVCPTATSTAVPFDALTDTTMQGILSHPLGTTTFTVLKTGIFFISGTVGFSSSGGANTGERKAYIAISGRNEQQGANLSPPQADPNTTIASCNGVFRLTEGTTFEIIGLHTQGANLNLLGSGTSPNQCCKVEIVYLS